MDKARQSRGNFPTNTDNDRSTRFVVPVEKKGHSSFDQNKGEFPVKTSRGSEKRFIPPKI